MSALGAAWRPCSRQTYPTRARLFSSTSGRSRQRLVVLGSGWGGYSLMKRLDKKRYDVTLISPNTYFGFTPLLASTAVGTLEFRAAVETNRRFAPEAQVLQAWADEIDFKNRTLKCMPATPPVPEAIFSHDLPAKEESYDHDVQLSPYTVPFDKLVIAVGAYAQTFGIPGVKQHALFLKDSRDARRIRTRIIDCFEQAAQPMLSDTERKRLLHFALVGGGPTGVELAAEIHDLCATDMRRSFPGLAPHVSITLYEAGANILQSFDEKLAAYAQAKFKREGVGIRANAKVTSVGDGFLELADLGRVHCGMLVWSTGLAANPLIASIDGVKKDAKTHGLLVDDYMRIQDAATGEPVSDVWAIGDATVMEARRLPATAQVANQQSRYVAKSLNRLAKNREVTDPFKYRNLGQLSYIGDWEALYDRSQATSGPKNLLEGRVAWLLYRSAYISQALSWRNTVVIVFYYFVNWIFGRDLARF